MWTNGGLIGGGVPGNNVQAGTTNSSADQRRWATSQNSGNGGSPDPVPERTRQTSPRVRQRRQQDGTSSNVNHASATTSPIQVRDTSADDSAVAMDEGYAQNADGGGTNVLVTNPQVALAGKNAATGAGTVTDNSTDANLNDSNGNANSGGRSVGGINQQGTTNVYVPDAAVAGHDAVTGGSTLHRQLLQRPGPRHGHRQCRRHHQPHPGAGFG